MALAGLAKGLCQWWISNTEVRLIINVVVGAIVMLAHTRWQALKSVKWSQEVQRETQRIQKQADQGIEWQHKTPRPNTSDQSTWNGTQALLTEQFVFQQFRCQNPPAQWFQLRCIPDARPIVPSWILCSCQLPAQHTIANASWMHWQQLRPHPFIFKQHSSTVLGTVSRSFV